MELDTEKVRKMFIKFFKNLDKTRVGEAGGKGASLGEMTRARIPVPPGFVVLSSAFDRFLNETELHAEIEAILKKVNHKDINSVDRASNEIRELVHEASMPKDLKREIVKAFRQLKAKFVAVRSSATAEDSKIASWAGELETYLNVTEKNLIKSVGKCWSSLFTPRAIFYAFEKGTYKKLGKKSPYPSPSRRGRGGVVLPVSVAVVVQSMVQSEISGICFTVHPVTKDRNQMVIEAAYGLGEAVVGGQLTPDTYLVHKNDFSALDINVSEQNFAIIRGPKGTVHKKLNRKVGGRQKLNQKQITDLAKLCKKIEQHYRHPQDIEWARAHGRFYILQSRPITTLR